MKRRAEALLRRNQNVLQEQKEESYEVNGRFHTRMQGTMWLCTTYVNEAVGHCPGCLKGLNQYLKGVVQLLADDRSVFSCYTPHISHHWPQRGVLPVARRKRQRESE